MGNGRKTVYNNISPYDTFVHDKYVLQFDMDDNFIQK